jgi:hypothetical protein
MLFKETLDKFKPQVEDALDQLYNAVLGKQTHEQDLLLLEINGFYVELHEDPEVKKRMNLSPFVFGPGGWEYFTDHTQYRFFNFYRQQVLTEGRADYFKDFDKNEKKQHDHDIMMQMELMIYLKFWESDKILKRLCHLSNLAQGKNYDWYFKIDKDDSRHTIIREHVRDPIKNICPLYYNLLKDIYLSQIRNATAHSDFYITGTKLGFNNVDVANHAPLGQIDFQQWEERFHKLILLYNGLIGRSNFYQRRYIKSQEGNEYGLQIRMTKNDGTSQNSFIKYLLPTGQTGCGTRTGRRTIKGNNRGQLFEFTFARIAIMSFFKYSRNSGISLIE